MNPYVSLLLSLSLLFFLSRITIQTLYETLRKYIPHQKLVFILLSLFYLPGTFIHEVSHALMATILFLKVRSISLIPQFKGNSITLGHVLYEKKDIARGILVGIAPIFGGILTLYFLFFFHIFPQQSILINTLGVYLIFVITSTMFSSKQDLKDFIYCVPFLLIMGGLIYIFFPSIKLLTLNPVFLSFSFIVKDLSWYLLLSSCITVVFLLLLKVLQRIL
jgi:hypothetical protein